MTADQTRVLVLGGDGMLGHKVFQVLAERFDAFATFRRADGPWTTFPMYRDHSRAIAGVNALDFDSVVRAMAVARPQVVVNGIGIIKQLREASDPILSISVNSLFPHRLAELCRVAGARMIHVSTDCVFSGNKGCYTESDTPDADDLYGRSKLLGEVDREGCLTIRTSVFGRDFIRPVGLLEWFLSNRGGRVQGYTNHIYTGFPTNALARIIADLIEQRPDLNGLYQIASAPIAKGDLLVKVRDAMALDIDIDLRDVTPNDRSLDPSRFVAATGYRIPTWDEMIAELAADPTPYDEWRKTHATA
jgi:dTDP-4-dehydrorhamnose reductase